jgi:hypothetical protein
MPTGYEVGMYRDIEQIRQALEKIAAELELLRKAAEWRNDNTPDRTR